MYLFSNTLVLKPSFDNRNMQAHFSLKHQQNEGKLTQTVGKNTAGPLVVQNTVRLH